MILLTAFKGSNNSSKILLDMASGSNITKNLLTNSFDACEREIVRYISECSPKYVISFGRKPVINRLYIEPIACRDDVCNNTNFDISLLKDSLTGYGVRYKVSDKPSNYLCNHAYFAGLEYIKQSKSETKMIFIHTPDMKRFQNIDLVSEWLSDFCTELGLLCQK